jgi:hypothetical protein
MPRQLVCCPTSGGLAKRLRICPWCAVTAALQMITGSILPAATLQADRLRIQAELQVAQERSRALGEELSLIRSTLLPLLSAPAATAAVAAGAVPASQPANASLAALAQVMQQQQQQTGGVAEAPGSPMAAVYMSNRGFDGMSSSSTGGGAGTGGHTTYTIPYNTPTAALAAARQYDSPARAGRTADPALDAMDAQYSSSPAAVSPSRKALEQYCSGGSQQLERATPQRGGGGLAGLVSELQSDVDKLQQQLHSTRRQLHWEGRPGSAVETGNGNAVGAGQMHHTR